jgi:hypothetical protein
MKETGRIELPPSFIHRIRKVNSHEQELVCRAFTISNSYPNNIVSLTENRIMFCVNFQALKTGEGPGECKYFISGFIFDDVKPVWEHPCSSFRVGLHFAGKLNCGRVVTVSAMQLVSKCFVFQKGHCQVRLFPERNPLPHNLRATLLQYQAAPRESKCILEESMKISWKRSKDTDQSYLHDWWWVENLYVPGRHTNYFQ